MDENYDQLPHPCIFASFPSAMFAIMKYPCIVCVCVCERESESVCVCLLGRGAWVSHRMGLQEIRLALRCRHRRAGVGFDAVVLG